jgi:hypothetical protein
MRRTLVCLSLLALVFAVPAGAEVFFVTLNNGTTFETAYQPQASSWDPGMVLLLTEQGNWIGLPQSDIREVRSESQIAGYGRSIDNKTFDLGVAPNDAEDPNAKPTEPADVRAQMLEQMVQQQQQELNQRKAQDSYTVQQFVEPSSLQGIPSRFIGTPNGSSQLSPGQNQ